MYKQVIVCQLFTAKTNAENRKTKKEHNNKFIITTAAKKCWVCSNSKI